MPQIELRRGAGAYICGEESAMIESIEGKRDMALGMIKFFAAESCGQCTPCRAGTVQAGWSNSGELPMSR